jgi:hypothetical protein
LLAFVLSSVVSCEETREHTAGDTHEREGKEEEGAFGG